MRSASLRCSEATSDRLRAEIITLPRRFALCLATPLGSWIGGALVERLLGTALD